MSNLEARLADKGISVPQVPTPVASYVPAVQSGKMVFTAGQLPLRDGQLLATGILGKDISVEQGTQCARACALNCIAAVKSVCGDLDQVARVVKLTVFVASTPEFTDQPKVANGASDFLLEVFGDAGKHARSAVGVPSLPRGVPVEVEMIVELK